MYGVTRLDVKTTREQDHEEKLGYCSRVLFGFESVLSHEGYDDILIIFGENHLAFAT